ncbi:MAG: ABC transporter permease [Planctomycetota bacterium]|jgi:ABC-type antimicrobial peptide transport system permease subunit
MSWVNIYNRLGRFLLIFLSIAVVVAFLISSFTYGSIISDLSEIARKGDVRTRAALEKVGVFVAVDADASAPQQSDREMRRDDASQRQQADQETWLMILSCVLCVVVITNTMLMSVSERVSEIGTLKCLGALDRFIVRMFLVESVFIGVVASAAGVAGGYLLTILGMGISLGFGTIWGGHMLMPLVTGMPIGVGAGMLITVLAAAYPAYVAAKMKPVDAMRAEI